MPSISHDDELHHSHRGAIQPCWKLKHGLAALTYNYLLALFLHVMAFVKRWSLKKVGQYTSNSNRGPATGSGGEDLAAMPSVSDDENKGSICICSEGSAAAPPFMPSLQVLHLGLRAAESHPNCCDNLGLEYLSSLWEINVYLFSHNFF